MLNCVRRCEHVNRPLDAVDGPIKVSGDARPVRHATPVPIRCTQVDCDRSRLAQETTLIDGIPDAAPAITHSALAPVGRYTLQRLQ